MRFFYCLGLLFFFCNSFAAQEEFFPYPAAVEEQAQFGPLYTWALEKPENEKISVERLNTLMEQTRFSVAQALLILGSSAERKKFFERIQQFSDVALKELCMFESPGAGTIGGCILANLSMGIYTRYLATIKRLPRNVFRRIVKKRAAANDWMPEKELVLGHLADMIVSSNEAKRIHCALLCMYIADVHGEVVRRAQKGQKE